MAALRRSRALDDDPAVSVVIPTRDRASYLRQCLESVQRQSFQDFEVIVVDDGSRDATRDVIRSFARARPARWRCLTHRAARGPAACRNRGLELSRGPFVAFLDSDDLWHPEKLSRQLPAFGRPARLIVYTDFDLIDAKGRVVETRCIARRRLRRYGLQEPLPELRRIGSPRTSTVIARREALLAAGGFDTRFDRIGDDSDLWRRLLRRHGRGSFHFMRQSLARYRWHGEQESGISAFFRRSRREGFERAARGLGPRDRERLLDLTLLVQADLP